MDPENCSLMMRWLILNSQSQSKLEYIEIDPCDKLVSLQSIQPATTRESKEVSEERIFLVAFLSHHKARDVPDRPFGNFITLILGNRQMYVVQECHARVEALKLRNGRSVTL